MQLKKILFRSFLLSVILSLFSAGSLFSTNYTAVSSGIWSSSSTWGGVPPSSSLLNDNVTIPSGIDVTLNVDVTIGLNSSVIVDGSLSGTAQSIIMNFGSIGGSGTITIGFLDCGAGTTATLLNGSQFTSDSIKVNGIFTGSGKVITGFISCLGTLNINGDTLLAGYIDCNAIGDVSVGSGAVLAADSLLDVRHLAGSGTFDLGLLDCGAAADITLGTGAQLICNNIINRLNVISIADGSIQVKNQLDLIAGGINLTGNAMLSLTDSCWIFMRGGRIRNLTSNDITAYLNVRLSDNADTLSNDLSLGEARFGNILLGFVDPAHEIILGENILVNTSLDMSSGIMNLDGKNIVVNGEFLANQGAFRGNASSGLSFTGTGAMDSLRFAPGFELLDSLTFSKNLPLNLASRISVDSALKFSGTYLNLNGNNLSVNGDFSLGDGLISGSDSSDLSFSGHGVVDTLEFTPGQNILDNFSVSMDTLSQVILGSDIHIIGTMFTTSGEVVLQGTTLTITGSISKDKGLFVGSASASMVIEGVDTAGIIAFKPGSEFLDSLVINRQGTIVNGMSTGVLWLQGDLTLNTLKVDQGMFNLAGEDSTTAKASGGKNVTVNGTTDMNGMVGVASSGPMKSPGVQIDLNLNGDLVTTASGLFAATTNLDLNISGSGSMDTLAFATAYDTISSLVYDNATELILGSDIAIWDTLSMSSGTINIANSTISINGTLIIDYAAFIGSPVANMIISGSANIDTLIFLAQSAELNDFTVSVDSGNSVTLGADLTVNGNLYMVSGELVLSGDTLTVNGNVVAENGSLSGNANATLIIGGIDSTSVLTFTEGAQELKELVLNSVADTLLLGSNLQVDSLLTLTQGVLNIGSYNLIMDSLASISGYNRYHYIAISDTGKLIQYLNDTGISVTFPIGTLSAYTPVTLNQNSTTAYGQYAANVMEGVYAAGDSGTAITQNAVNTTWNISTTVTDYNVSMQTGWSQAQEMTGFNSDSCYISHYNGTAWDTVPADSAIQDTSGMFFIVRDSITGMSPFTVMSGNATVCQMTAAISGTDINCFGVYDGTATVNPASGNEPYTYNWSNGGNTGTITGLMSGLYYVTVTDALNCQITDSMFINEPTQIISADSVTNASSGTASDGAINLTVSGGTAGYTFLWSNMETTEDISGLFTGYYYVTITDANGCPLSDTIYVDFFDAVSGVKPYSSVKIYPNPAKEVIFIENAENTSIEIYNILGNPVMKPDKAKYLAGINLNGLTKGCYFVKIIKGDSSIMRKINIE